MHSIGVGTLYITIMQSREEGSPVLYRPSDDEKESLLTTDDEKESLPLHDDFTEHFAVIKEREWRNMSMRNREWLLREMHDELWIELDEGGYVRAFA